MIDDLRCKRWQSQPLGEMCTPSLPGMCGLLALHSNCRGQSLICCYSLALMTYYGIVLLLSGYQADEAHIVKQDRSIVEQYGFHQHINFLLSFFLVFHRVILMALYGFSTV